MFNYRFTYYIDNGRRKFFKNLVKKNFYNTSSSIPIFFVKKKIYVYKYVNKTLLKVFKKKVGYKFGEFSFTKKPYIFIPKSKSKKKSLRR